MTRELLTRALDALERSTKNTDADYAAMADTERELLEMAAKAAGLTLKWGEVYIVGDDEVDCTDMPYVVSGEPDEADWHWNPLTDDGDALRLAVKLRLTLLLEIPRIGIGPALPGVEMYLDEGEDECAATRRAIVRAAAEIGASK